MKESTIKKLIEQIDKLPLIKVESISRLNIWIDSSLILFSVEATTQVQFFRRLGTNYRSISLHPLNKFKEDFIESNSALSA